MSTLSNPDSINHKQGTFKPSVAPEGPMTDKGHQPGRKANEADQRGEFHMERHPPGTTPASNSYSANSVDKTGSQANNPDVLRAHGKEAVHTSTVDTLRGANSADVHTGFGKPLVGETSFERAHDGAHGWKHQCGGLEGVGTSIEDKSGERKFPDQRGYERENHMRGLRGNKEDRSAADMWPEPAETLDAEWKYEPGTKR